MSLQDSLRALAARLHLEERMMSAGECTEAVAELDRLQARVAELEMLLHRIEPYIDGIVCYASTMDEHEPNRIAHDLRAAIDTARKAKP